MHGVSVFQWAWLLSCTAWATPVVSNVDTADAARGVNEERSLLPITNKGELSAALKGLEKDINDGPVFASIFYDIITDIVPSPGPTAASQVSASLSQIFAAEPTSLFDSGAELLLAGLAGGNYKEIETAFTTESSSSNHNSRNPAPPIYPKAKSGDAPYSLSEEQLRSAIYIPPNFTYGKVKPIIFIPGAGQYAGQNFAGNFAELFADQKIVDPVFLNVPSEQLGDYQVGAEYISYAVHYISSISKHQKVSTLSWSVGCLQAQWSLQYWPSTRTLISSAIRISPAYHGTILADLICPNFPKLPCTPGISQVRYDSNFVATLRAGGGADAYVPTTNVWSIFDELVEPQAGRNASAHLGDSRGVGVANVELQHICSPLLPGATLYNTHEGVLYNGLAYALAVDALTHADGIGRVYRVNAHQACSEFVAPGLSLADVFATEAVIPLLLGRLVLYEPKVYNEPPIKPYAK